MNKRSVYASAPKARQPEELSYTELELTFEASVFGPVKTLQYFAALNILPSEFSLECKEECVEVKLVALSTPASERLFKKIRTLPTLINYDDTRL